jgi:hypothetical protein
MSDPIMTELLTRLETLGARVDEQDTEIKRLKARSGVLPAVVAAQADTAALSRRDLLVKGTVGLALTALGTSMPEVAHADTRTTVSGQGTEAAYGAAVSPAGSDPDDVLPPLGGFGFALVASTSPLAPSPSDQSAVLGTGSGGRGVQGLSNLNYGVYGQSDTNIAVRGEIPGTSMASTIAIYGLNYSTFTGGGPGQGGFAIYGLSAKGHGLVGATAVAGASAVVGATNGVAGAFAATFYGPVVVGGDFIVVGGAKSAAVRHPDGSHRLLYCIESPESWFEDFGEAQLDCGHSEVTIDSNFAAAADTEAYHVFLTAYDNDQVLHVTNRTPTGFTVQSDVALAELKGKNRSDLSGAFSWRIVAKRKDIKGERFARVTIPPEPTLPPKTPPRASEQDRAR